MKGTAIATILLICLAIALPTASYFAIKLPADVAYSRKIGSYVTMVTEQSSFENTRTALINVWQRMNTTFPQSQYPHNQTFGSYFYWDCIYENSLAAEDNYMVSAVQRLNSTIKDYNNILSGNKTITGITPTQWYQQTLASIRTDFQSGGGIDWALPGIYGYNYQSAAWWMLYWLIPIELAIIAVAVICAIFTFSED